MSNLKVIQLLPELNFGGVERGVKDFSKALVDRGHQSIVISNGGLLQEEIENNGAKHINLPIHKKRISSLFLASQLKEIYEKEKPDIVHIRSRMPAWINFFAFKKLKKRPLLISTFHGLYSTPIYSQVMSKVDHTISISNTVKNYIQSTYKMTDDQITIIPRGCDSDQFNEEGIEEPWLSKWYEEFPQTKEKIILTIPGRITRIKGQDHFIEVIDKIIKKYPNIHGLIIGEEKRKSKYMRELKDQVTSFGLDENITFVGHRKDVKQIMSISKIVFSLTKVPEAFGRISLESLSLGIPVIAYSHGGVKEQLSEMLPQGLVSVGNINNVK